MGSKHLPVRKGTNSKLLIAAGMAVTAAFIAICGSVLIDMGERDYEKAHQSATNVVASLDADIERNFETYDLSLQAVADGMNLPTISQVDPEIRQLILFDRAATAKHMGSIFVLDRNGVVTVDSLTIHPKAENYSKKEFFQAFIKDASLTKLVSRPWVSNTGEHLISISRRITARDGSFQGVVVGTIKLTYFHDLFRKLKLHEGDALFITRTDGTMIMRAPFDINVIGRDFGKSRIANKMSRDASGSFDDVAALDGIKRQYVYKKIDEYPLRIGFGQAFEGVYAGWWHEFWRLGIMVFLVSVTNIALVLFLAHSLRRRADAENALAVAATTDGLTGLCNRRRFDELFAREWRRAQRTQTPIALLMIDADQFKQYNDTFGHQAGDEALVELANCIASCTRRGDDFGARYGGEEFVVLLPGKTTDQAFEAAEHIRSTVLDRRNQQLDIADVIPTVSIGVASFIPSADAQNADLLKAADIALYEAKCNGRNRTQSASPRSTGRETVSLAA